MSSKKTTKTKSTNHQQEEVIMSEPTRKPNIVVMSTKGGVGKSMLAQQVAGGYLVKHFGSADVRALDDQNTEGEHLNNSKVNVSQVKVGDQQSDLDNRFDQALDFIDEGVVVDVGGNKTTEFFISALANNDALIDSIDLVIIPVIDNLTSTKTAIRTLKLLEDSKRTSPLIKKVAICLNRVEGGADDDELREAFFNTFDLLIEPYNLPYFALQTMTGAENIGVLFQKTIVEVEAEEVEIRAATDGKVMMPIAQKAKAGDKEAIKELTRLKRMRRILNKNTDSYAVAVNQAIDNIKRLI